MINYQENELALSLYDIHVKVSVWMRDLGLGFIEDRYLGLLLDNGTSIAVLVQFIEERLHVPGVKPPIESSPELTL